MNLHARYLRRPLAVLLALLPFAALALPALAPARPRAATRATALRPLAGLTINVDPGHNPGNAAHAREINRLVTAGPIHKACDTTGAATNAGWPEAAFTGDLATRVARRLRALGAAVTFTRANGSPAWGPCITGRAAIGNRADVAISLHADGNLGRGARGFHVIRPGFVRGYTGDIALRSSALATRLRDQLLTLKVIPPSNYIGHAGIDARTDLGGLTLSDVPKVFLEAGNMRDARDARVLTSPRERERIAAAVAAAIVAWHRADRAS